MTRREGARRSLAVDADLLRLAAADRVLLELGDVVGDVVDQLHAERFPRLAEDLREDLARLVGQELAVAPGVVGGRAHRAQVGLALRTAHRCTGELRVGQLEAVPFRGVLERRQVVVAHLVAQPARARVNQDGDLAFVQAHDLGRRPRSRTRSTTWTSRKWLPEPSVPHWS